MRIHPDLRETFAHLPSTDLEITAENVQAVREHIPMPDLGNLDDDQTVSVTRMEIPAGDHNVPIVMLKPTSGTAGYPVCLQLHGGGMFLGSADDGIRDLAILAKELQCILISPEYRLAPEHPYPAAVDDCYAALLWIDEHIAEYQGDRSRIIVMGGSAGAGLSAAIAMKARDEGGPHIAYQCLMYPMIDDRLDSPSKQEITDGRISNRAGCISMWKMYLSGLPEGEVPVYAAPVRANDFTGLPPAFLAVGQLDPFRDETIYFAQQLMYAGVPTELHVFPGCFHGWDAYAPGADVSKAVTELRLLALRKAFAWEADPESSSARQN